MLARWLRQGVARPDSQAAKQEAGQSLIGQDGCDVFPAWDPHEGISFSHEILWKSYVLL